MGSKLRRALRTTASPEQARPRQQNEWTVHEWMMDGEIGHQRSGGIIYVLTQPQPREPPSVIHSSTILRLLESTYVDCYSD